MIGPDAAAREAGTLRRVRARLTRFCDATIRSGLAATPGLRIRAVVLTRSSLSDPTREAVADLVSQFVSCDLPGARLDAVTFGISAVLRGPCDVRVEPVTTEQPLRRVDERWPGLRLVIGPDRRGPRQVFASRPDWLPVGLGPTGPAVLEIRYYRGPVDWRRTHASPECPVEVDGRLLAPGQVVPGLEWGRIAYRTWLGPPTTLDYHLTWDGTS